MSLASTTHHQIMVLGNLNKIMESSFVTITDSLEPLESLSTGEDGVTILLVKWGQEPPKELPPDTVAIVAPTMRAIPTEILRRSVAILRDPQWVREAYFAGVPVFIPRDEKLVYIPQVIVSVNTEVDDPLRLTDRAVTAAVKGQVTISYGPLRFKAGDPIEALSYLGLVSKLIVELRARSALALLMFSPARYVSSLAGSCKLLKAVLAGRELYLPWVDIESTEILKELYDPEEDVLVLDTLVADPSELVLRHAETALEVIIKPLLSSPTTREYASYLRDAVRRMVTVREEVGYRLTPEAFSIDRPESLHEYADRVKEAETATATSPMSHTVIWRESCGEDTECGLVVRDGALFAYAVKVVKKEYAVSPSIGPGFADYSEARLGFVAPKIRWDNLKREVLAKATSVAKRTGYGHGETYVYGLTGRVVALARIHVK